MMVTSAFFEMERDGDVLIVVPQRNVSSLADAAVSSELDGLLGELDESGVRRVVFDFGRVSWFGSTMLEAMLVVWNRIHPDGGRLALCNVSAISSEIVRIAHFDTIWPVCPSRDEALAAVRN
jgi:anti-sigma B factor antagonist